MNSLSNWSKCCDSRDCFAKDTEHENKCIALRTTYKKDGQCPFCKPRMDETKGKIYPFISAANYYKPGGKNYTEACTFATA